MMIGKGAERERAREEEGRGNERHDKNMRPTGQGWGKEGDWDTL